MSTPVNVNPNQKPVKTTSKTTKLIRDLSSCLIWIYCLLHLLVFDVDGLVFKEIPANYRWLVHYKPIVLMSILSIAWFSLGTTALLKFFSIVAIFPFILFWRLTKFIWGFKNWNVTIAFINALLASFKSIKYNFITLTIFLVSSCVVLASTKNYLLWPSAIILLTLLGMAYLRRMFFVLRPSAFHQAYMTFFNAIKTHGASSFHPEKQIRGLSVQSLDEKQIVTWTNNLQMAVLFNRVCLFTSRRLHDYQKSGLTQLSNMIIIFLLLFFTVTTFTLANFALYKIDHSHFSTQSTLGVFDFFYYSFSSLFFGSVESVFPLTALAKSMKIAIALFSFFLTAIFGALFLPHKSQQQADELKQVVLGLKDQSVEMEQLIAQEYNVPDIDSAILELKRLKANMLSFILKLSEGIE